MASSSLLFFASIWGSWYWSVPDCVLCVFGRSPSCWGLFICGWRSCHWHCPKVPIFIVFIGWLSVSLFLRICFWPILWPTGQSRPWIVALSQRIRLKICNFCQDGGSTCERCSNHKLPSLLLWSFIRNVTTIPHFWGWKTREIMVVLYWVFFEGGSPAWTARSASFRSVSHADFNKIHWGTEWGCSFWNGCYSNFRGMSRGSSKWEIFIRACLLSFWLFPCITPKVHPSVEAAPNARPKGSSVRFL